MTMKKIDRRPVAEKSESIMGDIPKRNAPLLTCYTVYMHVGRQQLR